MAAAVRTGTGSRRRKLTASDHDEGSATEPKRKKVATRTAGEDGEDEEARARCRLEFFDQPCADLARAMLGCVLVCCGEDGEECRGKVVEVEAYLGGEDKAAHSYNGRRSKANQAMYMAPGTAYVYSIYGMHSCFNVSSRGEGAAVLVRALQPGAGLGAMRARRGGGRGVRKDSDMCSGPGKLCRAMGITKQHNQMDLVTSASIWLERGEPLSPELVGMSPRVGIDYAGPEWASAPLRFFQTDCASISRPRTRKRQDKPSS